MPKKYIITGGSGFIGKHLSKALLARGDFVEIFDRAPPALRHKNLVFTPVDLRDGKYRRVDRRTVSTIFHLAGSRSGPHSVVDPLDDFMHNAVGTLQIAMIADRIGVEKLIYLSTASVYGKPLSRPIDETHPTNPVLPYGASKLAGEIACRALYYTHSLPVVIARAFAVYGPGDSTHSSFTEVDRFARFALNKMPVPISGNLDLKTRDFVNVDDVVRALLVLDEKAVQSEVYNIGSGVEVSQRELISAISKCLGERVPINYSPSDVGDTYRLVADISKIRLLGYWPRISLAAGLAMLIGSFEKLPELPRQQLILRRSKNGKDQDLEC